VEELPALKCSLLRRLSVVVEGRKEVVWQRGERVILRWGKRGCAENFPLAQQPLLREGRRR